MAASNNKSLQRKAVLNSAKVALTAASLAATLVGWGVLGAGANSVTTVAQASTTSASQSTSTVSTASTNTQTFAALATITRTRASR